MTETSKTTQNNQIHTTNKYFFLKITETSKYPNTSNKVSQIHQIHQIHQLQKQDVWILRSKIEVKVFDY